MNMRIGKGAVLLASLIISASATSIENVMRDVEQEMRLESPMDESKRMGFSDHEVRCRPFLPEWVRSPRYEKGLSSTSCYDSQHIAEMHADGDLSQQILVAVRAEVLLHTIHRDRRILGQVQLRSEQLMRDIQLRRVQVLDLCGKTIICVEKIVDYPWLESHDKQKIDYE